MPTLSHKLCCLLSDGHLQASHNTLMDVSGGTSVGQMRNMLREVELVLQMCAQLPLLYVPIGSELPLSKQCSVSITFLAL